MNISKELLVIFGIIAVVVVCCGVWMHVRSPKPAEMWKSYVMLILSGMLALAFPLVLIIGLFVCVGQGYDYVRCIEDRLPESAKEWLVIILFASVFGGYFGGYVVKSFKELRKLLSSAGDADSDNCEKD